MISQLIYWPASVCHRNFPWTGPPLCFRKGSAFLVIQWLKNHLRFLVNFGRIHTSHGKVKTWCRVFRCFSARRNSLEWVFHLKMVVFLHEYQDHFIRLDYVSKFRTPPPRNPLVLFAKSTVLGLSLTITYGLSSFPSLIIWSPFARPSSDRLDIGRPLFYWRRPTRSGSFHKRYDRKGLPQRISVESEINNNPSIWKRLEKVSHFSQTPRIIQKCQNTCVYVYTYI